MRLGVEAAIVDGALLAGRRRDRGRPDRRRRAPPDCGGGIAAPGFVDLQVNGFGGVDFAAPTRRLPARRRGAARDRRHRLPADVDHRGRGRLRRRPPRGAFRPMAARDRGPPRGPLPLPRRIGAHPARRAATRIPAPRAPARGRPVAHMTLAPELPGALELIDLLHARGSSSRAATPTRPPRGPRSLRPRRPTVTHLFNAMRPLGIATPASPAPRSHGTM